MNKKILVVNGPGYAEALKGLNKEFWFNKRRFLTCPEEFELVLFTGGEDISPELYGHTSPKRMCQSSMMRDEEEIEIFEKALENNIPMTGICRGSQLLNVLSGGVMMHHIGGHAFNGIHTIRTRTHDTEIYATSTHHQMCVPGPEGHIVAWADPKRSTIYVGDGDEAMEYSGPEVEAIYYPRNNIFAVQYHPEYMPKNGSGYKWFENGVKDLLTMDKDCFYSKYVTGATHLQFNAGL